MRKIGIGLTAALFIAAVAAPALATKPSVPDVVGDGHKVTICHATSSSQIERGWIEITVDIASSGGLDKIMGHKEHAVGQPNNRGRTDVIPKFSYEGQSWGGFGDPAQLKGLFPNCVGAAETATLIVKKVVLNDSSSLNKTASDFAFSVVGPTPSTGNVFIEAENPNDLDPLTGEKSLTVNAGTYTVTEDSPIGYTPSYSADCANVFVASGDTVTCTITNDDPSEA